MNCIAINDKLSLDNAMVPGDTSLKGGLIQ